MSAIFFMRKADKTIVVESVETPEDGAPRYRVTGNLFFASADVFAAASSAMAIRPRVEIDMTGAHLWDLPGAGRVVLRRCVPCRDGRRMPS